MKKCVITTLLTMWCFTVLAQSIDISGEWNVSLPGNAKDGKIMLPSTTDLAGYGIPTDTLALSRDEQFRRLTRRNSFIGPALYSREIEISEEMAGKPLELILERVIWKSTAKIDGKTLENVEYSLVAPHSHILREGLTKGRHTLEIEIDNSKQYDVSFSNLAHAYTNDTQTMWNGILGNMALRVIPSIDIKGVEIYPAKDLNSVSVIAKIYNSSSKAKKEEFSFSIDRHGNVIKKTVKLMPGMNIVEQLLSTSGLEHWNEFNPKLYSVIVTVAGSHAAETFGLRTVGNRNGLTINDVPVFLRGTLECCVFPLTGVPPTNRDGWLKTFVTAKEWGLNHFRFHSWCPPEAAFEVADSLGMYLQVELPVWSLKIGDDTQAESFLKHEYENIVSNYGNHPSFIMLSVGNELQHDFDWLNQFVMEMKKRDPRHLYTTTSFTFEKGHGRQPEPEDQFFITQWTDDGWVRGQGVFETEEPSFNKNYSSALGKVDVPLITHEIGQYAVYPDISEIGKYTGTLNPLNFKNIREDLKDKGMIGMSNDMTTASGKLASILYKEEIERALKTQGISGYQLLGLQDFPGQGTALVGLLDAFWDSKGAVDAEWFRQFNSPVVPLLNFTDAVYSSDSDFEGEVLVANYSDKGIPACDIKWSLIENGESESIAQGTVEMSEIKAGNVSVVGSMKASLSKIKRPSAVKVLLELPDGSSNSWLIHVYPEIKAERGSVVCTQSLEEALKALGAGRKVLLSPKIEDIKGIESKFLPVFWSPVHFPKQAGTMGILSNPDHPALASFPNDGHTDWQWWRPIKNAKVVNMDSIPNIEPIVGVIDNFVYNRKLGYIFEAKVGNGLLLFTSIDVLSPGSSSMEIKALEASLLNYMNNDAFSPMSEIPESFIRRIAPGNVKSESTKATDIYQ